MKNVLIVLIMTFIVFGCVATCYHEDIEDSQAYLREAILPGMGGHEDLAP